MKIAQLCLKREITKNAQHRIIKKEIKIQKFTIHHFY